MDVRDRINQALRFIKDNNNAELIELLENFPGLVSYKLCPSIAAITIGDVSSGKRFSIGEYASYINNEEAEVIIDNFKEASSKFNFNSKSRSSYLGDEINLMTPEEEKELFKEAYVAITKGDFNKLYEIIASNNDIVNLKLNNEDVDDFCIGSETSLISLLNIALNPAFASPENNKIVKLIANNMDDLEGEKDLCLFWSESLGIDKINIQSVINNFEYLVKEKNLNLTNFTSISGVNIFDYICNSLEDHKIFSDQQMNLHQLLTEPLANVFGLDINKNISSVGKFSLLELAAKYISDNNISYNDENDSIEAEHAHIDSLVGAYEISSVRKIKINKPSFNFPSSLNLGEFYEQLFCEKIQTYSWLGELVDDKKRNIRNCYSFGPS